MASSNNEDIMSYDLYGVGDATFEILQKDLLLQRVKVFSVP